LHIIIVWIFYELLTIEKVEDNSSSESQCPGGGLHECIDVCPSGNLIAFKVCVNVCVKRCPWTEKKYANIFILVVQNCIKFNKSFCGLQFLLISFVFFPCIKTDDNFNNSYYR